MNPTQHLKVISRQRARQLYTSASPSVIANNYSPYLLFDFSHSPRPSPRKLPYQPPNANQDQSPSPGSPTTTLTSSYAPNAFAAQAPWLTSSTPAYALPPPLWLCPPLDAAWFPLALGIDVGPGPWDVIRVSSGKEKQSEPVPPVEKEVPWSFECGAFGIPKAKAKRTSLGADDDLNLSVQVGEDSYFVRPDALGVADGVGGWAHHAHADSARFARMLMHNCASEFVIPSSSASSQQPEAGSSKQDAAAAYPSPPETPRKPQQSPRTESSHSSQLAEALSSMSLSSSSPDQSTPTPEVTPLEALHAAYERTVATFRSTGTAGSSTALVAVLRDGELSVAHLGDCMLAVVRDGKFVVRSEEMQHSFNFPYQLGPHSSTTPRTDAQLITERVVPGDIVILASDGLGDNLWDEEVLKTVERFVQSQDQTSGVVDADRKGAGDTDRATLGAGSAGLDGGPIGETQEIAQALARRAKEAARGSADVPFGVRARAAGIQFMGGKTDDISVVVAVVRGPASASASHAS